MAAGGIVCAAPPPVDAFGVPVVAAGGFWFLVGTCLHYVDKAIGTPSEGPPGGSIPLGPSTHRGMGGHQVIGVIHVPQPR
jgi:hypothetical protein